VSSFTSEAVTSASFQGAPPPRPARSDQSPGNDSFGALVDNSTAADTSNDRANSAAQEQSASRRRSDDASAAADRRQLRNAASADRAAQNDSDDRDAAVRQRSDANADANTDGVQRSRAKSGASKTEDAKSTAKSNSNDAPAAHAEAASAADPAAPAQPDGPAVTTPNPVAVAIPVTVAAANVPAASPASGKATEPLAIAAAAIAASSAATDAPAASAAQTKIDASATAATASAAANATTADAAATAKINVQAASETTATPVNQPATPTDATAATTAELTAAVAATASVVPKVTTKTAGVAQAGTTASSDPETAPDTADPSATAISTGSPLNGVAQGPAVAGKPKAGNGGIDGIKADHPSANSSSTIATNISAREHSVVTEAGHAAADPTDIGVQATGAIQPQLHSSAAAAAPVGPLNVTAATNAAVPLSGLAVEIAVSAKSGKSRFEIRLDPADLGRIDVRIDVDRNGQVTSHLTVEKPETLSMLRQDAPQLQRALDDAGLRTGNGGLQFSLRDQSSSGQDTGGGSGRNAHRLIVEEDSIPAAVAGRTYGRMLGSSSGVDIKV
jgi:flagellar hook-length control protein FliK